jgi:acid phosphatase (class A)
VDGSAGWNADYSTGACGKTLEVKGMMMKRKLSIKKVLAAMLVVACVAAADPVFIKPADVDWQSILSGPPASGSDTEKTEIATILQWQNKRTASDIARCKSEEDVTPFIFSDVLGDKFVEKDLPETATLLKQVQGDIKGFTALAKAKWERKRPPYADDRIHPCVPIEENGSYPSAHAVRGVVWSRILAEMFPDKKDALLKRGLLMGEDRVIAGIHFPSDVEAGQKLGDAIADKLLADPKFKPSMAAAKDECEKAGVGK